MNIMEMADEIKRGRTELEKELAKLINEFQDRYGISVEDICMEWKDNDHGVKKIRKGEKIIKTPLPVDIDIVLEKLNFN